MTRAERLEVHVLAVARPDDVGSLATMALSLIEQRVH